MKAILRTTIIFLFLIPTHWVSGQDYTLETSSKMYEELQTPKIIAQGPAMDVQNGYVLKIPFTFEAFDQHLDFFANQTIVYTNAFIGEGGSIIGMGPFYARMKGRDATSSMSYSITGVYPHRILKFQWKNMGFQQQTDSDYVNMQLWLDESDNSVYAHIGPHRITSAASFLIGEDANPTKVEGPEIGIWWVDESPGATYWLKRKAELIGDPKAPQITTVAPDQALSGIPVPNTIYRFRPAATAIEIAENEIAVSCYPNPAKEVLNISYKIPSGKIFVELYDMQGRLLMKEEENNAASVHTIQFNISTLTDGIYLCRITSANKTYTRK